MKFLLVEDDLAFAESVKQLLETHYYSVDLAADGKMGEEMADVFSYDLILLDWMLPKKTGIEVCRDLREEGDRTPIILMTGQDNTTNEVAGLDAGADDYLVKPFGFEELLARIRALLRRSEGIASPILEWGDLRLNPSSAQVSCDQGNGASTPIALTPKEYGLLEVFLRNPNRIFSMDALIDKVWPFDDAPTTGAIRTHIKGLRQKMKAVGLAEVIDTVYGLGYRLSPAIAVVVADKQTPKKSEKTSQSDTKTTLNTKRQTSSTAPQKVDLLALWQPVQATYLQRVEKLAKTLNGLSTGAQPQSKREMISTEAHTLAGSLGSFGFSGVTHQCRRIEHIFRDHEALDLQQQQELKEAIAKVQQALKAADIPTHKATNQRAATDTASPALTPFLADTSGSRSEAKLLIVDDDPAILTLLEGLLHDWGFQMQLLSDPQQFWEKMEQFNPDMVLLDVEMPNISGFDLCQMLRDEPRWSELPILFLSAHTEAETIQRVFSIGADDYIRKPIVAAELVARVISWLERAYNRKQKAEVDSLTGVANRPKSTQEMTRLLGLAERYNQPFCLATLDLNSFKRVNNERGHAAGDRILRQFGACLRDTFRTEDIIGRWGGEEFVVGLYGVTQSEGHQYLNNLSKAWETQCGNSDDGPLHITFSAGIAVYPQDAADLKTLYQAADKALIQAKSVSHSQILAEA